MPGRLVKIEYKASLAGDLEKLDPATALRIAKKIERALSVEGATGIALSGELAGLYRIRVGDYRVIYARTTEGYLVLGVGHRREILQERKTLSPSPDLNPRPESY